MSMTVFKFNIGDCVRSKFYDRDGDLIVYARRPGPMNPQGCENQYDMIHEDGWKDKSGWFEWGLEFVYSPAEEYAYAVAYLGEDYFA